eukprot:5274274-Prymnesium_polylepis.1
MVLVGTHAYITTRGSAKSDTPHVTARASPAIRQPHHAHRTHIPPACHAPPAPNAPSADSAPPPG